MSGNAESLAETKMHAGESSNVLHKPYSEEELVDVLKDVMGGGYIDVD